MTLGNRRHNAIGSGLARIVRHKGHDGRRPKAGTSPREFSGLRLWL